MRLGKAMIIATAVSLSLAACSAGSENTPATVSGTGPGGKQGVDPLAKGQWSLSEIHGRKPLKRFRRPPAEVTIAFMDTGVALGHRDLRPRLWRAPSEVPGPAPAGQAAQGPVPKGNPGWDTIGTDSPPSIAPDSSPDDPMSHGTPVASVAAAATGNAFGMAGVAPNALVMPVRTCWNPRECRDELTAASMNWAVDNGARVVNMSLVTASGHAQVEAAITAHPDALFVAAADNFARDLDQVGDDVFPCEIPRPNVICVAASARGGALSSCTNFGAKSVDVAAPGEGLTVAALGGGFVEEHPCGTSLATPQVSGLAALLFGAVPEASAAAVRQAILAGATPAPAFAGKVAAGGIIDVRRSLKLLQDQFKLPRPPKTKLESAGGAGNGVSFQLRAGRAKSVGFECSIDGRPFRRCQRLASFSGLKAGRHLLEARALGRRGTADSTPARRSFRV